MNLDEGYNEELFLTLLLQLIVDLDYSKQKVERKEAFVTRLVTHKWGWPVWGYIPNTFNYW